MDILIIASLIIGAVILFLVELFVIPGISVAGFLAGGCIIFANYYAFAYMGTTAGVITLIISALACIGSLVWFMRSKTLDKIALKKNITSKVDRSAEDKVKVGDVGVTTTRLALIRLCRNQRRHRGSEVIRWLHERKDSDYRRAYCRRSPLSGTAQAVKFQKSTYL